MSRAPTRTGLRLYLNRLLHGPMPVRREPRRSLQTLAFEEVKSSPEKSHEFTAFVLHGLLGSGRNWRSFSRSLASYLSPAAWRMVLVDLRNHGKSAEIGLLPPHNLENAAKDLANMVKAEGWDWPDVVIGHSMGGKVALQFAQSCANGDYGDNVSLPRQCISTLASRIELELQIRFAQETQISLSASFAMGASVTNSLGRKQNHLFVSEPAIVAAVVNLWINGEEALLIFMKDQPSSPTRAIVFTNSKKQLWVLDSVPGKVIPRDDEGEVEKVLKILQSLPSEMPSRKWLVDHMLNLGFSKSLSQWIGSNLKKSGEHETWAFNLDGAVQMFNSYKEMDYWPLLEHPTKGMKIDIVRAEKSDRWDPDTIQQLEGLSSRRVNETNGKVSVHVLPNAGHWVHVDNPKGLLEILAPKVGSIV